MNILDRMREATKKNLAEIEILKANLKKPRCKPKREDVIVITIIDNRNPKKPKIY